MDTPFSVISSETRNLVLAIIQIAQISLCVRDDKKRRAKLRSKLQNKNGPS
jgi:hypothetical protein